MLPLIRKYSPLFGGSLVDLTRVEEERKPPGEPAGLRRVKTERGKPKQGRPRKKEPLRATKSHPIGQPAALQAHFVPPEVYLQDYESCQNSDSRRGAFSRKHYGSVELLISCTADGAVQGAGRFRVENGENNEALSGGTGSSNIALLENPECQTRWYFKYFLGKVHQNYVGLDEDRSPFFLSVVLTDANNHNVPQYRAILWRKTGTQKLCLPHNPSKPLSIKSILSSFSLDKMERGPKEILSAEIQKDLLQLEEQEGAVNFKFGVLYAKSGQKTDDEMFSNECGSDNFDNFVQILGEDITLKGWDRYRGGLDTKNNTTGIKSVYTVYQGHEIMFHVSTALPYSKDNRQQVERKRHIGNDIVCIVFQEKEDDEDETPSFKPSMLKSHFTHIFALVTFDRRDESYRLTVFSEESVPLFYPPLPSPPVFKDSQEFREFLLVKLINGEKAALNTPAFAEKRQRTMDMLIKNLHQEYMQEISKSPLNLRSLSEVIPETVTSIKTKKKEEARQAEFLRVGQELKLNTIVKGDAPTSMATTGLLSKREPWEPQVLHYDFPHQVLCGDSWGESLVVSTEAGCYLIQEEATPRLLFDKSVPIKQLSVVEHHGLLLFRAEKGKECKVHVFRLSDFEGGYNEALVRTKADCKDHRLERTKGCHLYALSRPGGSFLRMVVAIKNKLLLLTWKHSVAWTAWNPSADTDTVEGFNYIRELTINDVPSVVTLVDGGRQDNMICVGYKHQFDIVNEKNGNTYRLHQVEGNKVELTDAIDVYEDGEPKVLLCYNHVCQLKSLSDAEETTNGFEFGWNSEPHGVVCAFPYILAFTPDAIEIRLLVNGNLVHSMPMPMLLLVTSKFDLYFVSAKDPISSCKDNNNGSTSPTISFSPPITPTTGKGEPLWGKAPVTKYCVYQIPLSSLVGHPTDRACVKHGPVPAMMSPLVRIDDTVVRNRRELFSYGPGPQKGHTHGQHHPHLHPGMGRAATVDKTSPATPTPPGRFLSRPNRLESCSSEPDPSVTFSPPPSPFRFSSVDQDEDIDLK
ncbi:GTPase-activating Rap/Ran-GAP domain-like protein 3 isoform X3 [Branchiostoma lanceolatum]|uniref:GTPase-activating Rap/Ran-GAP domain-like protein 3 isoform X3 n=1 Tax=Branchiostoma lanceolatum TaxID=7740 RepID=UPI0034537A58